jgi:hypothetical protein
MTCTAPADHDDILSTPFRNLLPVSTYSGVSSKCGMCALKLNTTISEFGTRPWKQAVVPGVEPSNLPQVKRVGTLISPKWCIHQESEIGQQKSC